MWETFFGFQKTPFPDCPYPKQLFASQAWNQAKARLEFLVNHHATGLLTGEVEPENPPLRVPSAAHSIPVCTKSSTCTGPPAPAWICYGTGTRTGLGTG
jgi:hypothetical protein